MTRPSPRTTEALRSSAELYLIEAEIRGNSPDERRSVRQARARPLLDDLERWLRALLEKLSRKSDTFRGHPVRPEPVAGTAALLRQRPITWPPWNGLARVLEAEGSIYLSLPLDAQH